MAVGKYCTSRAERAVCSLSEGLGEGLLFLICRQFGEKKGKKDLK